MATDTSRANLVSVDRQATDTGIHRRPTGDRRIVRGAATSRPVAGSDFEVLVMGKNVYKYVSESGDRRRRSRNIATAILELRESHPKATGVRTSRLRAHIRAALKLPELKGETHLGDLRAHGDALGGHGLKLEVVREGGTRVVKFSPGNLGLCQKFLDDKEETGTLL